MRNMKTRMIEVLIFLCCYTVSLLINIILGFGSIAFGDLVVYSIIFCLLECIQLFLLNIKIQVMLFFINIYISYCLTGVCLIVLPRKHFFWKSLFCITFWQYLILLGVAILFSAAGYIILFIKYQKEKTIFKRSRRGSGDNSDSLSER